MSGVLLITGGSRGIGAATACLAARQGYAVAINYRAEADRAAQLVGDIAAAGGRAIAVQADVARQEEVERLFQEMEERLGRATALVNAAGVTGGPPTKVVDFEQAALERLMAVNVIGTMLCCREAVRRMSTAHGGAIVNVSSMAATIGGRPGRSAYAASKAAIDSFTIGLAKEVAQDRIRVNAIRPGMTLTDMTESLRRDSGLRARIAATIAMNRCAEAEEIAQPILWLLSPEASFVSGAILDASGGGFMLARAVASGASGAEE
jgi:NAD(P)-dependent dehydrogenase (short-subunit alcohol dehydrogenase family)